MNENKRINIVGIVIALLGLVSILVMVGANSRVVAATNKSHAGHDHGHGNQSVSHQEEDMESLFDEDDHEDHGHAKTTIDEHHDDHDGHRHAEHAGDGGICPEHRVPEEEDALCHGDHLGELVPGEGMKVRLASTDVAAKAGIGLAKPQEVSLAAGNSIPGRVQFNRNRLARITPISTGIVQRVNVQPGELVTKGDLLAQIVTPETAALKAQLLTAQARQKQAEATYHREKDLLAKGISSRQEFQEAEAVYHATQSDSEQYRQQLLNYGFSTTDLEELVRDGVSNSLLSLRAPLTGTVVEFNTAAGEAAEPGTPLFTIADLDSLWIELSVPESRLYLAQYGAPIQARFSGLPGMVFTGQIFQAGAVVDDRTRTLKVLAEMNNPDHRLKVGMFGDVRILDENEQQVLAVHADALQSIDGKAYVFIQQENDLFELRRVQAGAKSDGMIPILAGLSHDEQVVSSQGFALKSEVLKARLGASCADH